MDVNGKLLKLLCFSVSKGVDKVPDHWFERLPIVGKFYHHSIHDSKPTTTLQGARRTKNRESRHRRSPHDGDVLFRDRSHKSDAGHRGRKKGSRSSTRKSNRSASVGCLSDDEAGTPRAYNPADYAFSTDIEAFPSKLYGNSTVPAYQQPNDVQSPSGPCQASHYIPYAEIYSGRRGGSAQPLVSPTTSQLYSPQSARAETRDSLAGSPHSPRRIMQQSQEISNQGSLAPTQATYAYPAMPQPYSPGTRHESISYYSASDQESDFSLGRSHHTRRSSRISRRSSRAASHSRKSRIDLLDDLGAGHLSRDKKKAAALATGTAIGGLVGKKMGGLPGALVGLASGYGLARSMTKAREPPQY